MKKLSLPVSLVLSLPLSLSLLACSRGGGSSGGGGTTSPPPPPPSLTVSTASLPGGTVGVAYSATLAATGGAPPYTWSLTAGALPAGLSLAGSTISGTPTTPGTSNFTVQASDGSQSGTQPLSITIAAAGSTLTVTTTSMPSGTVGVSYSGTLAATGGAPPYTWSLASGTLPAGLSLSGSTISGTPTTPGTSAFTVQASDGTQSDTQALSITINAAGGAGWSTVAVGTTQTLYGLDFKNSTGFIVGMTQTILKTTDGGATWAPATSGFYSATTNTAEGSAHILSPPPTWGTYHLLCVRMVDENTVWMSSAGPLQAPSPSYGANSLSACFVTSNSGSTWTRLVMATNFQIWGISGWNGTNARAASIGSSSHTDSDIFTISGATNTDSILMSWNALYDIQMVSPTLGFAAGDTIHKTTDGSSWNATSAPSGQYRAVFFVDASIGWAVADGGKIIKTANGGSTWTTQTSGTTQNLWGVSFADASNGWVVGKGGTVLRTTDGGTTWASETSGTTNDLYDVKALSATTAWAVGATGTVIKRQ